MEILTVTATSSIPLAFLFFGGRSSLSSPFTFFYCSRNARTTISLKSTFMQSFLLLFGFLRLLFPSISKCDILLLMLVPSLRTILK